MRVIHFLVPCLPVLALLGCNRADAPPEQNDFAQELDAEPDSAPQQQLGRRVFRVYGDIIQGMSRADLMRLAQRENYPVTFPFGSDFPTVEIDRTEYTLGFCEDKLTHASWTIDSNEKLIKSMSQRMNEEGLRITGGEARTGYNDAMDTDVNQVTLLLRHPQDAIAYSVEYVIFNKNSQIDLVDTRFDDTLNCAPEPAISEPS